MANAIEKKLLEMYGEIGMGACDICRRCREENPGLYPRAVGCWFVGDEFERQEKRVLFIGKNARGAPAEDYEENRNGAPFLNEFRHARRDLWDRSWAYWSYTRAVCENLFGDTGFEAAAFTNMVKCNGSDTRDTTTDSMRECCIAELGVIKREIEIIRPTHVVCITGADYDYRLTNLFDGLACTNAVSVAVGSKTMPWAEFDAVSGRREIKVLRVGHPERKKKEPYVAAVTQWLKKN